MFLLRFQAAPGAPLSALPPGPWSEVLAARRRPFWSWASAPPSRTGRHVGRSAALDLRRRPGLRVCGIPAALGLIVRSPEEPAPAASSIIAALALVASALAWAFRLPRGLDRAKRPAPQPAQAPTPLSQIDFEALKRAGGGEPQSAAAAVAPPGEGTPKGS